MSAMLIMCQSQIIKIRLLVTAINICELTGWSGVMSY